MGFLSDPTQKAAREQHVATYVIGLPMLIYCVYIMYCDMLCTYVSLYLFQFLEAFHMTQLFENFIEQRENPSKAETVAASKSSFLGIPLYDLWTSVL